MQQRRQQLAPGPLAGDAADVGGDVDGGDDAAGAVADRGGEGAQAVLQLLVDQRVALPPGLVQPSRELADACATVRAVNASRSRRSRCASSAPSSSPASSTRPIEVAYAGKRVPTLIATVMIREVGTRAT